MLFQSFSGGGLTTANRLVMAPMTRRVSPNGVPTQEVAAYYERRAAADIGLIVTEGTWINHPSAANSRHVPRIYGEDALDGWSHVVERVHAAGSRIVLQLWHVGARADASSNGIRPERIVSPSGFYHPGTIVGEPISDREIAAVVDAYASAASTAQRLGFDGVEYHAAHGYFIDQFFWGLTNLRTDGYGGDLPSRTRAAVEILTESRRRVGREFPLILRISQFKADYYDYKLAPDPQTLASFIEPLTAAGVSLFHCSQRRFWEPEFAGSDLNLAGWVKKVSGLPTITVGSVGLDRDSIVTNYTEKGTRAAPVRLDRLEQMLERGDFDLVAVGRALLQDPLWARKVRTGRFHELSAYDVQSLNRYY
jgi:2,4-dienoyl-CoA reductase-like NADH-dependent reductase (Old Yellow Enzyme family)